MARLKGYWLPYSKMAVGLAGGESATLPLPGVDGACTLAGIMWTPLQGEKALESVAMSAQSCAQSLRRGRFSGSLLPRVPPPVSTSAGCVFIMHCQV